MPITGGACRSTFGGVIQTMVVKWRIFRNTTLLTYPDAPTKTTCGFRPRVSVAVAGWASFTVAVSNGLRDQSINIRVKRLQVVARHVDINPQPDRPLRSGHRVVVVTVDQPPKSAEIDILPPSNRLIGIEVVPLEDFTGIVQRVQDRALSGTVGPEEQRDGPEIEFD